MQHTYVTFLYQRDNYNLLEDKSDLYYVWKTEIFCYQSQDISLLISCGICIG